MKGEIRAFARDISQSKPSIAAIFICSHADCDYPYGSDGNQISLENDVFAPLEETNLPEMKGKPKLVFIQACQKIKRGKTLKIIYDAIICACIIFLFVIRANTVGQGKPYHQTRRQRPHELFSDVFLRTEPGIGSSSAVWNALHSITRQLLQEISNFDSGFRL